MPPRGRPRTRRYWRLAWGAQGRGCGIFSTTYVPSGPHTGQPRTPAGTEYPTQPPAPSAQHPSYGLTSRFKFHIQLSHTTIQKKSAPLYFCAQEHTKTRTALCFEVQPDRRQSRASPVPPPSHTPWAYMFTAAVFSKKGYQSEPAFVVSNQTTKTST